MQPEISSQQQIVVGISQYISKGQRVLATTKYLLTDFVVNQVDKNGVLVTLKKKPQDVPMPKKQLANYSIKQQLLGQINEVLGQDCGKQIEKLYEKLETGQKISKWEFLIKSSNQKEARSKIHNFIRQKLYNIESTTVQGSIKLEYKKNLKKRNPISRKKYIHFTLYKTNVDTAGAIYKLGKVTNLSPKLFSTAGLKDKRGATTQRVSLYNCDIDALYRFYQCWYKNKQIWIDDFLQNQPDKIGVGDLQGNQFGLILRCVDPIDQTDIQARVKSLREIGMINYFGMQRFGNFSTKTHEIGLLIIKKKWKDVVQKLLLEQTGDQNVNALKQELYLTGKFNEAERSLPNKMKIEKMLFRGLQRFDDNFCNVFESLPRNMKTIYIHALQSYIWNNISSRRIKQFGLKLVEGDLVGSTAGKMEEHQKQEKQKEEQSDVQDIRNQDQDDQEFKLDVVSKDNIDRYTINDLVAPLYGPTSQVPEKCILHQYIQDELQKLNLKTHDFTENAKFLCFKGNFRRIIIKPQHVKHTIIKHTDRKQEIQSGFYTMGDTIDVQPGNLTSIHLILRLPKSSYATMAIREILHLPSSFECQKTLNKMYQQSSPLN